ncbi:MAG: hypothetical protein U0939_20490 [Pirellulales bacterium]
MNQAVDAAALPLRLRWRPDLQANAMTLGGRRRWIVRDPLTRRHFQFQEEEFSIAMLLDGRRSLREIEQAFATQWPLLRFSAPQFQHFLSRLHRDGLLIDDAGGQGRLIRQRRQQRARWSWVAWPAQLLALRLPGFNPAPLLDRLYPRVRWWFSPWFVAANLLLMAFAAAWAATHPFELQARMPDLEAWLQPRQLWLVAFVLGITKALHELGHALACRHFGGECREMGVMLLAFTPCLYCDVGDAWLIPDRWRRAAVAAAGMYVEATIASVALVLWWNTAPGWLHHLSLAVVGVCGVSTFVFNANPLLRYDGYFILSDLLDAPNLWQRSRDALRETAGKWFLGLATPAAARQDRRSTNALLIYALGSTAYRVVVFVGCVTLLVNVLRSWRLEQLGWMLAAATIAAAVAPVGVNMYSRLSSPLWRRRVRPGRVRGTFLAVAAVLAAILFVPLPARVSAPALLQVESAAPLYVTVPGTIERTLAPGARVARGEVVIQLANPEVERQLVQAEGEVRVLETRVAYLESVRGDDPHASARIPAARESLAAALDVVAQRRRDLDRLALRADVSGVVLAPPDAVRPIHDARELSNWGGTPLEPWNRRALLENGTLAGWVGEPHRREAIVFVAESEIERVAKGQTVRLAFAAWPTAVQRGRVTEIAPSESSELPAELAQGEQVPFRIDERGVAQSLETLYQVRVALEDSDLPPLNRVRGEARISVAPQSLGDRLLRAFRQTFIWSP